MSIRHMTIVHHTAGGTESHGQTVAHIDLSNDRVDRELRVYIDPNGEVAISLWEGLDVDDGMNIIDHITVDVAATEAQNAIVVKPRDESTSAVVERYQSE